ncbi:BROMODOMAIN AND WD REPEAT-CONTAINING PROTEIN 1-LIKE [Salix koriyanagi]|uniref:BROMODOMAIN AND WD REPEAT-CONTAINING PROTEIN 1-LIKE n=1 Tax=Salix koriyanagi TaxID=2511006 RepID=A0A9Q0TT30_9ROSI|nr:BROMODOMAIN AND WD REPEAT-CONTAINING PROTEIN 1-LIKE [Salix koriyanagi]
MIMKREPKVVDRINLQRSLVFLHLSGQSHGSRNEAYASTDSRFEKNDETAGSILEGKHIKKHLALDENRRNTYKQFHPSAGGRVPSVLNTFDAERKQLVAAGLLTEHGYARSIARFAANIGPFSWTIEVKRIDNQLAPPPQKPFSVLESSAAVATACSVKSKQERLSTKPEKDIFPEKQLASTRLSDARFKSCSSIHRNDYISERAQSVQKLNSNSAFNVLNSIAGVIRQRAPFQLHQNSATHSGMIGFNATCGFNLAAQMGKLIGVARPAGLGIQSSQMADEVSRTNSNLVRSDKMKIPENSSSIKISGALPNPGSEALEAPRSVDQAQPTWEGLYPNPRTEEGLYPNPRTDSGSSSHQKMDAVPPDLNVRYQSPGSPSYGRVDPAQPDLALQL